MKKNMDKDALSQLSERVRSIWQDRTSNVRFELRLAREDYRTMACEAAGWDPEQRDYYSASTQLERLIPLFCREKGFHGDVSIPVYTAESGDFFSLKPFKELLQYQPNIVAFEFVTHQACYENKKAKTVLMSENLKAFDAQLIPGRIEIPDNKEECFFFFACVEASADHFRLRVALTKDVCPAVKGKKVREGMYLVDPYEYRHRPLEAVAVRTGDLPNFLTALCMQENLGVNFKNEDPFKPHIIIYVRKLRFYDTKKGK